jgi:3-phenylpropionate/trans-cinnamate dioxygenase ferredoxin component
MAWSLNRMENVRPMTDGTYVEVATRTDIVDGKPLVVTVDGQSILLCASDEAIFAIENRCSHADQPLECGRIRLGWINCPAHGARFDLETGEALNPPATAPIRTFPVRVEGERIFIAIG